MEYRKYWDEHIETMPREEIREHQLEDLKKIVKFAYDNSPYYKRAYDEAGVKPEDIKTLDDIQKFPFVDKTTERQTQGVGSFLGEMCAVPEEDVMFIASSSGTTGMPTISPFTKEDRDSFIETSARMYWQMGLRPNDRYIHSLNLSLFVAAVDVLGAEKTGAMCIWGGVLPFEKMFEILKDYKPTAILTTPSYAWKLGQKAVANGFDPKKDFAIKRIFVGAEPGGSISSTRDTIEKLWGADVYDAFGCSDINGMFASVCEEKNGLHIAEDKVLIEVVDPDTGEILKPGETGEIVYTDLTKKARPMIRFRSGDIGRIEEAPCPCGRTHRRFYIIGRKDDMFIVSGVNVFPSAIENIIRKIDGITGEYLIRVFEIDLTCKYSLEIEKSADNTASDEEIAAKVSGAIKAAIGARPYNIVVHPAGAINLEGANKVKRLIDERKSK